MSEEVRNDEFLAEPTDARFSMRSLLAAMTLVAVLAAIGGAVLQRSGPNIRIRLIAFWAVWLAGSIAYIAFALYQRKRAERQAGPTLLQLPMRHDPSIPRWLNWHTILFLPLTLVGFLFGSHLVASSSSGTSVTDWILWLIFPAYFAVSIANAFLAFLWQDRVRFCQRGILSDRTTYTWDQLLEFRWDNAMLELHFIDQPNNRAWLTISVAPKARAKITDLLDEKLSSAPTLPAESRRVGIGQVPISAVVTQPHLRRHLIPVATSVLCGLSLAYLVLVRDAGARAFEESISISFLVCLFIVGPKLQWMTTRGGTSLVRLFARQDWPGLVATVAAAIAIYNMATKFIWWPAWFGYAAGFAYCWLMLKTFTYFFATQLDLRADGIVMHGAFYWPWKKVRLRAWDRDGSGRLVLARGLRRVIASVPPGQRELVDRVLREKLGLDHAPSCDDAAHIAAGKT